MKTRTHLKVLFPYAMLQLILLAAHVTLFVFWEPVRTAAASVLPAAWVDAWLALLLHGVIVLIEVIYVVVPVLRWWTSVFEVTPEAVTARWGLLWKQQRSVQLAHIVRIDVERGVLDRIFGSGTLVFYDAATLTAQDHGPGVRFRDVPRALDMERRIAELRANSHS